MSYVSEERRHYERIFWRYADQNLLRLPIGRTITSVTDHELYDLVKPYLPKKLIIPEEIIGLGLKNLPFEKREIIDAYRKKVQKKHPDKGGKHEGFIELKNYKEIALKNYDKGFYVYKENMPFDSPKDAGNHGENLFRAELRRLKGMAINGFIRTNNIVFLNKNFQLDFLIFAPKVGLILTEVKYHTGKIYVSNEEKWRQKKSDEETYINNPLKQVIRTDFLLKKLLKDNGENTWPIVSLVVFAHPKVEIIYRNNIEKFQTPVIRLSDFEKWLENQNKEPKIKFCRFDFHVLVNIFRTYTKEYEYYTR